MILITGGGELQSVCSRVDALVGPWVPEWACLLFEDGWTDGHLVDGMCRASARVYLTVMSFQRPPQGGSRTTPYYVLPHQFNLHSIMAVIAHNPLRTYTNVHTLCCCCYYYAPRFFERIYSLAEIRDYSRVYICV